MKADQAQQLKLLELQQIDTAADQLDHKIRSSPAAAELAALTEQLAGLQTELVTASVGLRDLNREITRAEGDVAQVVARAKHDQELIESGKTESSRQILQLESEIESLQRRQGILEDQQLEIMERVEEASERVDDLETEIQKQTKRQRELQELVDAQRQAATQQRESADIERQAARTALSADLLGLYDRLRDANSGVAVALLRGNKCEGCRMQLAPSFLSDIASASSDDVIRCEECSRILLRPPAPVKSSQE